jgi:phosphoglycerate dehydrogenase-like enzyme
MSDVIVIAEDYERTWTWAAGHARQRWAGPDLRFVRLGRGDLRTLADLDLPPGTRRILSLGVPQGGGLESLPVLEEVGLDVWSGDADAYIEPLRARGVTVYRRRGEGFWGQSVAEFALGLTIAGLRRIPQTHGEIVEGTADWIYAPPTGEAVPNGRGFQFGDDPRFTSGTIAGKRVRVVGMGNIGARFASFCQFLGADLAAWDDLAPDSVFHRSRTRRVHRLTDAVADAEIFAPMVPRLPATMNLISAELIDALPTGCLVVCVTRMQILDSQALRRRVLADELSLAADVFDLEPLPAGDPLIGRHNVVHTPHNAGRTIDANRELVDMILDQFA